MDSGVRNRFLLRSFSGSNRISELDKTQPFDRTIRGAERKEPPLGTATQQGGAPSSAPMRIKRHVLIQFNKLFGWV